MQPTIFLIGFTIMSLGSLAIYVFGSKRPPAWQHTLIHSAVPFIAATSYLAMAFGIGTLFKLDGTATYVARYLDWSVTTPLLLAGLVLVAFHERDRTGGIGGFLTAIIVLDVLMIVTGLIASAATVPLVKWVWYLWSCVAFGGVLYLLWFPLRRVATERGDAMGTAYAKNLSALSILWVIYPVAFLVGPEGLRAVSDVSTVWFVLVLDVLAKVAYAFYAAANLDRAIDAGAIGEGRAYGDGRG